MYQYVWCHRYSKQSRNDKAQDSSGLFLIPLRSRFMLLDFIIFFWCSDKKQHSRRKQRKVLPMYKVQLLPFVSLLCHLPSKDLLSALGNLVLKIIGFNNILCDSD